MDEYHVCTACFQTMDRHKGVSDYAEDGVEHFPPLCCPGCQCGSFEIAYPLPPAATVTDPTTELDAARKD